MEGFSELQAEALGFRFLGSIEGFFCYMTSPDKMGTLWLLFSVCFGFAAFCEAGDLGIKSPGGFTNYIVASYFDKYESLADSAFLNFLADDLLSGSCQLQPDHLNLLPRISITQRHLVGQGSHRHLSSTIKFSFSGESSSELRARSCKFIAIEKLPSGVFADPFELRHLLHRGAFTDVTVMGDTNLELPSFLSGRSAVEIHMTIEPKFLSGQNELEMVINLPLHARYPPLDESGYYEVRFGGPDLLMNCSMEVSSAPKSCLFMPSIDLARSNTIDNVWKIPSGRSAHATIVSVVTFVAAFASTVMIVVTSIIYSDIPLFRHLKQS